MSESIKVFISYAHEDEDLRQKLDSHLILLCHQGMITTWYDRDITAGAQWQHEMDIHLNTAQIILLLISVDFLASKYCYGFEMQRAMERQKMGEARVIPIILRPVDLEGLPFSHLQVLPTDAIPVIDRKWHHVDEALLDVVKGIRKAIDKWHIQLGYETSDGANSLLWKKPPSHWLETDVHTIRIGISSPKMGSTVDQSLIVASGQVEGLPPHGKYLIVGYVITDIEYEQGGQLSTKMAPG